MEAVHGMVGIFSRITHSTVHYAPINVMPAGGRGRA